jgi:purine-binding chemotaxis protein CheW
MNEAQNLTMTNEKFPWVVFRLEDGFFALSSHCVQAMISVFDVKPIPGDSQDLRGVINHANQVFCLVDMRKKIGLKSVAAEIREFADLMDAREQDHKKWLNTLEECIQQGKEFTLAINPAKCRFGLWYDDYMPKVKNNNLAFWLKKFDVPHKKIHGIAEKTSALVLAGEKDKAIQLIEETRNKELKAMINLFAKIKLIYQSTQREIAIVIDPNFTRQPLALLVDEVIIVRNLPEENWQKIDRHLRSESGKLISGFGQFSEIESLVMTLDIACFA